MSEIKVCRKTELPLKPDVPGARMWAVGMKKAMLTYFDLEPNTVFPEHSHEAEQITLVLEGELTFVYDGKEVTLKSGDVIAIPSNAVHSAYTGDLPCKAVDAWSPPRRDFLSKYSSDMDFTLPSIPSRQGRGGLLSIPSPLEGEGQGEGDFLIRPATFADMSFIKECIERFRLDYEDLDYRQFVVAVENDETIGFGRVRPHKTVYELGCVGVMEGKRNQGIGRMLVEHLISIFPSNEVYITTDLPKYFERFGFKKIEPGPQELVDKLQRVCKSKCRERAVVMAFNKES